MIQRASVLLLLLASAPARSATDPAEEAYQEARTGYYALKGDPQRRKLRHHWLNAARKFERVAERHPTSDRAPDALFTAGELLSELSRISRVEEDLTAAISAYRRLVEGHPTHRLSDDGALLLARLYLERAGDPEAARRVVDGALFRNGKGDRARELKALRAALPPEAKKKAVARRVAPKEGELVAAISRASKESRPAPRAEQRAPLAPEPEEASEAGDPLSGVELPKLADIQEKLRKVRVGPTDLEPSFDEELARERLEQLAPAVRTAESEPTLAEQLGLKVRRVVIDPGHGGHDTGAIGASGLREKDVALAIARTVAEQLREAGLEVLLTRDDDTFVRLEERARLANEAGGDLFISIHCNSAPTRSLRGIETYTLNTSANRYSIRLAARENASSEKGLSDLRYILADLATKANTEESSRLARKVQQGLVSTLSRKYKGIRDLGHKEALFFVLLGAKMPAILVETSFLSHAEEEKLLASPEYQRDVAGAIASGVREFLGERLLAKAH